MKNIPARTVKRKGVSPPIINAAEVYGEAGRSQYTKLSSTKGYKTSQSIKRRAAERIADVIAIPMYTIFNLVKCKRENGIRAKNMLPIIARGTEIMFRNVHTRGE